MSSLALLPEEIIKRKIVSLPPHTPSEFFLSGAIPNCLTRWEHVRIAILSAQVLIAGEFKGAIRRLGVHSSPDHQGELSDSEIAPLSGSLLGDGGRLVRPLINQGRGHGLHVG